MNILSSLNLSSQFGNGGLFNSFKGLFNSSQQFEEASKNILEHTGSTLSVSSTSAPMQIEERVEISSLAESNTDSSLEEGIVELNQAGLTYTANARLVKASSSVFDALLRTVA